MTGWKTAFIELDDIVHPKAGKTGDSPYFILTVPAAEQFSESCPSVFGR